MKKLRCVLLSALLSTGIVLQCAPVALAAPNEVYSRLEMNSADYFLNTDHDEFGNARLFPSKTTFSATDAVSGATTMAKRFTINTDVGTNAKYTYASPSSYTSWANAITRITSLSYDWAEIVRYKPQDLGYEKKADGLEFKTSSLAAGIYTVRVYSEGSDTFIFNLNIQKPAPTVKVKSETITASQPASFTLEGLGFSWKGAVHEIELNGAVLTAEQYSIYDNVLTLYEDALTKVGENTLKIMLYGYKDAVGQFDVEEGASMMRSAAKIDAVSSATSSGGSGDIDTVSGATGTVPAFLTFKFDMVANAQILRDLGKGTVASEGVLKWWEDSRQEVVRGDDMNLYDWQRYLDSGLSFENYVASKPLRATAQDGLFWDMWETKNVLENGMLGDPYDFYEQIAAPYPEFTVTEASWKTGYTLKFNTTAEEFKAWADGIKKVEKEVHTNTSAIKLGSRGLYGDEWKIDAENLTLHLTKEALYYAATEGAPLYIRSSGFKTIKTTMTFATGAYTPVLVSDAYHVGDNVEVTGLPADIKDVTVKIGDEYLFPGTSSGSYRYFTLETNGEGKKLVVNGANFATAGTYSIYVTSGNYAPRIIKVDLAAALPTYRIGSIAPVQLSELKEQYSSASGKSIKIQNTGNQPLTNLKAVLSDDTQFTIVGTLPETLAAGKFIQLTIKPKDGLTKGSYQDTVTITADNEASTSFQVSQVVIAAEKGSEGGGTPASGEGYFVGQDVVITGIDFSSSMVISITVNEKNCGSMGTFDTKTKTLTLSGILFETAKEYRICINGFMTAPWEKTITVVAN